MRVAKKFSISGFMNDHSKKGADGFAFKIEMLELGAIYPSEANAYSVDDVAELKASIELVGLQQNLLVRETDPGRYELVSGHRRLIALKELFSEGKTGFGRVPCKVIKTASDIEAELQLIFANSTSRRLSDYELIYQARRLKEILTELKESGFSYTGKKREIIAEFLKVSPSQVSKYESINKNLSQELTEELKNGEINVTTAYELSKLPGEKQDEALAKHKSGERLTPEKVKAQRIKDTDAVQCGDADCPLHEECNPGYCLRYRYDYLCEEDRRFGECVHARLCTGCILKPPFLAEINEPEAGNSGATKPKIGGESECQSLKEDNSASETPAKVSPDCAHCGGNAIELYDTNKKFYIMCLPCGMRTSRSSVRNEVHACWKRRVK